MSVNRRPLSGTFRASVAQHLLNGRDTSQSLYHTKLASMSHVEYNAGNTTVRQSPKIMRQASYEARRRTQLDRDVVTDLMRRLDCILELLLPVTSDDVGSSDYMSSELSDPKNIGVTVGSSTIQ